MIGRRWCKNLDAKSVVYLVGYGRSGSTTVADLLGSHPDVFVAGEINYLAESVALGWRCTCGEPIEDCAIWQGLIPVSTRHLESPWGFLSLIRKRRRDDYRAAWQAVLGGLRDRAQRPVVLDCSKTSLRVALRPLAMRTIVHQKIRVLWVVRPLRSTLGAIAAVPSNWQAGANGTAGEVPTATMGIRLAHNRRLLMAATTLAWMIANTAAAAYYAVFGGSRVKWIDLQTRPQEMSAVAIADLGLAPIIEPAPACRHFVGGNRSRWSPAPPEAGQ